LTGDDIQPWQGLNYFNYFTEIEERFQLARGTGLFLLSPLDWALIESWKNAGIPLEAVVRGIDAAFEKWRSGKRRTQNVNSLAYCSQAVAAEAQAMAGMASAQSTGREQAAPFDFEELRAYLTHNAEAVAARSGYEELVAPLRQIASLPDEAFQKLEEVEQRLSVLEGKMIAIARTRQSDEALLRVKQDLDRQLKPYRGKMTASQLDMLERQYLDRRLLEDEGLPRLSLFHFR
jgi:hypothetical protein